MVKDSDRVEGVWLGKNGNTIMVWFSEDYWHSSKYKLLKRQDGQTNKLMRDTWGHKFIGPREMARW
jgi:hypothetical protein